MEPSDAFKVSVPGRVCLFGEHQDFLGLSVIAMAIDLRMSISAEARDDDRYFIMMPDIDDEDSFAPRAEIVYEKERDYLRSTASVLKRTGLSFDRGYDFTIESDIPMNAGVSSSSALVIGWATAILRAHRCLGDFSGEEIAKVGHAAEVLEFKEPGGMMDHYTCSLGGLLYIDCQDPIKVSPLEGEIKGFVLGNSLEKKDTVGVLRRSKEAVFEGVRLLKEEIEGFDLKTTPLDETIPHLKKIPSDASQKVYANLVNRDICQEALKMLQSEQFDNFAFGELIDRHHEMLRDHLGISTEMIEDMIDAAKSAGALGCKINGSGGGGTMIAFAPGYEEEVAEAIESVGGAAHIIEKDDGVRLDEGTLG